MSCCATVAPHRSQRASSPHATHASSRARPLRFSTHTDQPPPSRTRRSASANGAVSSHWPGSSSRGSTAVRRGQRCASGAGSPRSSTASTVGAGVTMRSAAPARRARSTATSRAFQVGARSSSRASSASSNTTTAARSGTGAHTAVRPPTTTHAPARAPAHAAVRAASEWVLPHSHTSRPAAASCAAISAARVGDGSTTMVEPSGATRASGSSPGPVSTSASPSGGPGYTACSRSTTRSGSTRLAGDATRRKLTTGPAQRQAAHSQSASSSGGGPADDTASSGRRRASAGSATSGSSTQPRTRRPWSSMRTWTPRCTAPSRDSGTR